MVDADFGVPSAPLNLAHREAEKADLFFERGAYSDAAQCHNFAAAYVAEAMQHLKADSPLVVHLVTVRRHHIHQEHVLGMQAGILANRVREVEERQMLSRKHSNTSNTSNTSHPVDVTISSKTAPEISGGGVGERYVFFEDENERFRRIIKQVIVQLHMREAMGDDAVVDPTCVACGRRFNASPIVSRSSSDQLSGECTAGGLSDSRDRRHKGSFSVTVSVDCDDADDSNTDPPLDRVLQLADEADMLFGEGKYGEAALCHGTAAALMSDVLVQFSCDSPLHASLQTLREHHLEQECVLGVQTRLLADRLREMEKDYLSATISGSSPADGVPIPEQILQDCMESTISRRCSVLETEGRCYRKLIKDIMLQLRLRCDAGSDDHLDDDSLCVACGRPLQSSTESSNRQCPGPTPKVPTRSKCQTVAGSSCRAVGVTERYVAPTAVPYAAGYVDHAAPWAGSLTHDSQGSYPWPDFPAPVAYGQPPLAGLSPFGASETGLIDSQEPARYADEFEDLEGPQQFADVDTMAPLADGLPTHPYSFDDDVDMSAEDEALMMLLRTPLQ